jgi:2-C-methyl-D-erythritol 4-phosphate cytidylyltransferase
VHDAVRPFVSSHIISTVIEQAERYGAAVVGVPAKDTIKMEGKKGFYARTLPRDLLWAVQTPQGFRFDLLLKAHNLARKQGYRGTDEASLVERLRHPVRIVQGDEWNVKITTPDDLKLAHVLAGERLSGR